MPLQSIEREKDFTAQRNVIFIIRISFYFM